MFSNKDYSDDLINEKIEPIIIKQDGGSDKKFIYTIIILLVLLFILALGVIAYLGSKYLSSQNKSTPIVNAKPIVNQNLNTMQPEEKEAIRKAVIATPKKIEKPKQKTAESDLEQLIAQEEGSNKAKPAKEGAPLANSNVQKAVSSVANKVAGTKLSKEDLATIAKLVAEELKKSNVQNSIKAEGKDKELVRALQAAPTDTLKEQKIDVTNISNANIKAKMTDKKIDTFNKVIVKPKTEGDDEFAKLTQEIDSILQSKDVQQVQQSYKYNKIIQAEAEQREKELRFYVVKKGDTLSSIAWKVYGKASLYKKIYEANPDLIKNPNKIYIGMKLRVPAL